MKSESIFKKAGNPEQALQQWRQYEALFSHDWQQSPGFIPLLSLFGNSSFLVQYLSQHPELIERTLSSAYWNQLKPHSVMFSELENIFQKEFQGDQNSAKSLLRKYKYQEMTRIAARDLSGSGKFEDIGDELANLASVCTEFAFRSACELLPKAPHNSTFSVLGLGKMGGGDLNFSSDIDILYIFDSPLQEDDGHRETQKNIFEYYCRISETITSLLQERTSDGIVFRVDLNLRPEGQSGVIVNSIDALATYYEISGAHWERAALIKARPVAGNESLGQAILHEIEPFVYPKLIDSSAIFELKTMKEKINRELRKTGGFNVKLGVGGIREIEFFVAAFQLIYGGKEIRLRERNTLKALDVLRELKMVPEEEISELKDSYIFLRQIENRLQMEEERQIHSLPQKAPDLLALARRMNYENVDDFMKALEKKTAFVSSCFEKLAS